MLVSCCMEITSDNRVPDVYEQRTLIKAAYDCAYEDGLGELKISVVEPADSLDWHFTVVGEDDVPRRLTISTDEQLDHAHLREIMSKKLRELLAY